jgi:uncharacterized protein YjbK
VSATQIGLSAQDVTLALTRGEETPEGMVDLVITDHVNQHEVTVTGTVQTLRQLVHDGLCLPIPANAPVDGVIVVVEQ